jgi:integrase/recombinase XerD
MDLLDQFKADMKTRGFAKLTIIVYTSKLKDFQTFMSNGDLANVNKDDIRNYIDHLRSRGYKTSSISGNLTVLSSFYDFLLYDGKIIANPVLPVRKRYLRTYKTEGENETHKLISIEDASRLIRSMVDIRDKTLLALLFKTGIRKGELLAIDLDDINLEDQSILLKGFKKRSNRLVYFDNEMTYLLNRWLDVRQERFGSNGNDNKALFLATTGKRISRTHCFMIITHAAERAGLHNPKSDKMEDHFSPHCCRHFFTTHLLRAGMSREYVKELRGDIRGEAINLYHHIDKRDLKKAYLAYIPQLGI